MRYSCEPVPIQLGIVTGQPTQFGANPRIEGTTCGKPIYWRWSQWLPVIFSFEPNQPNHQWIGLRENLQESPIFNGEIYGFRLRFSLKPIHWNQPNQLVSGPRSSSRSVWASSCASWRCRSGWSSTTSRRCCMRRGPRCSMPSWWWTPCLPRRWRGVGFTGWIAARIWDDLWMGGKKHTMRQSMLPPLGSQTIAESDEFQDQLTGVFSNFLELRILHLLDKSPLSGQVDKSVAEAVLHRLFALLQDGAMEPWTEGRGKKQLVRLC